MDGWLAGWLVVWLVIWLLGQSVGLFVNHGWFPAKFGVHWMVGDIRSCRVYFLGDPKIVVFLLVLL